MTSLVIHRGQAEAGDIVQQLRGREIEAREDRLEQEAGGGHIVTGDIITRETQPGKQRGVRDTGTGHLTRVILKQKLICKF